MGIFRDLTKEERTLLSERKAQVDSVFLANDVVVVFESTKREFEVSEISDVDSFKKLMHSNVNYIWENDLTDNQKRYYHQNLVIFIATPEEQKSYFERLISLAVDVIIKRISDFLEKHKDVDVEKIFFSTPAN